MYNKKRQNTFIVAEQMHLLSCFKKKVIQAGTINSMLCLGQNSKGLTLNVKVHTVHSFATLTLHDVDISSPRETN